MLMEWLLENWVWVGTPAVAGAALGILKVVAKKTSWVYDDKIVTLLEGIIKPLIGKKT